MPTLELGYLADHPEAVAPLARWHHAEWGSLVRDWPLSLAEEELRHHVERRALPTTIVAWLDGALAGSASLLVEDMPDFPPLSPWLGSVYVAPWARGRGIGRRLVERVTAEARSLGVRTLYLFTTEARAYYEALGWDALQPMASEGRDGVIMHFDLGRASTSFPPTAADAARNQGDP